MKLFSVTALLSLSILYLFAFYTSHAFSGFHGNNPLTRGNKNNEAKTEDPNKPQHVERKTMELFFQKYGNEHPKWEPKKRYIPTEGDDEDLLELDDGCNYHLLLIKPDPNKVSTTINQLRRRFPDISWEEGRDIVKRAMLEGGALIRVMTTLVSFSSFFVVFMNY